jgi:hypothetical protein
MTKRRLVKRLLYRGYMPIEDQLKAITVADFGANIHDLHRLVHELKRTPGIADRWMHFLKSSVHVVSDRNIYHPITLVATGTKPVDNAHIHIVVAHKEFPVILSSNTPLVSSLTDVSKYIWTPNIPLSPSITYLESKLKFGGHTVDSTGSVIQRLRRLEIVAHGQVQMGSIVQRILDLFDAWKTYFILDSKHDIDVE